MSRYTLRMKTLWDDEEGPAMLARIEAMTADSPAQWGKMDAAQMCAHVAAALEAATGVRPLKRSLLAKLLGGFFRGAILGAKPFPHNGPTHPDLVVKDERAFQTEKDRLVTALKQFLDAGREGVAKHEHAMIGAMTGDEWGTLQHKHIEHHLNQFGL